MPRGLTGSPFDVREGRTPVDQNLTERHFIASHNNETSRFAGTLDGASRTRTDDLLGAIQNRRIPERSLNPTDCLRLQGLRVLSVLARHRVSTRLQEQRGCIWVATPVVGGSNSYEKGPK
jgi:hypothetical protein